MEIYDLNPSEPKGWHWSDANKKPLIQFQQVDINSLWTDSVTLSLGEQMVAIRTFEEETLSVDKECVLRIFSVMQNHQTIITLEYAVFMRILSIKDSSSIGNRVQSLLKLSRTCF